MTIDNDWEFKANHWEREAKRLIAENNDLKTEALLSSSRTPAMGGLTSAERFVINRLVDAWNAFVELPREHNDDVTEFRHGIHRLQEKVMCRPIRRPIGGAA